MAGRLKIVRKGEGAEPPAPSTEEKRSLKLLSVRQAAEYAGVSRTSVRRWIIAGDLKIYRAGRQIRIDEADLISFLEANTLKWL